MYITRTCFHDADKQCPHVDSAADDHVKNTALHGIHIAAAFENHEVFQRYIHDTHRHAPAGIFGISPCHVAISKGKSKGLEAMLKMYPYTNNYSTFFVLATIGREYK